MIAHGDELGRTQQGNNNVYCQDNELSWVDWDAARDNEVLTEFTARLAGLRAAHPIFRRQRFFQGQPLRGTGIDDIAWLRADGQPMNDQDWDSGHTQTLAIYLNGRGIPDSDKVGRAVVDSSFLLLINSHHQQHASPSPTRPTGRPGRPHSTPPTRCSPTPAAGIPCPAANCACPRARRSRCSAPLAGNELPLIR